MTGFAALHIQPVEGAQATVFTMINMFINMYYPLYRWNTLMFFLYERVQFIIFFLLQKVAIFKNPLHFFPVKVLQLPDPEKLLFYEWYNYEVLSIRQIL